MIHTRLCFQTLCAYEKRLYEKSLRNHNFDTALEFSTVKPSPVLSSLSSQLLENIQNRERLVRLNIDS